MVASRSVLFSEGIALHLWKIRHIPNLRRFLLRSGGGIALSLMVLILVDGPRLLGQNDPAAPAASTTADASANPEATAWIQRVHQALYRRSSIRAEIDQTVLIGKEHFKVSGRYISSGQRLRLEYTIHPDQGLAGSLLEISDGKDLWSLLKVGDSTRVTHRDVQQIKAAAAAHREISDVILTAELGLGGLTALLASLERTMVFDAIKEEAGSQAAQIVVQGRWKPEIAARWPRSKDNQLPDYVPDLVRVWIDPQLEFPVRIVYVKRTLEKDKRVFRPMVSLSLKNVEFDGTVDDREFNFDPPENVVPEDITRQFLDRMNKSVDEAAAPAPAAPADPSNK